MWIKLRWGLVALAMLGIVASFAALHWTISNAKTQLQDVTQWGRAQIGIQDDMTTVLKMAHNRAINGDPKWQSPDQIEILEGIMKLEGIPFDPWVPGQPAPEDAE